MNTTPAPAPDVNAFAYEVAELSAEDGGGFIVTFPDVPGCIGIGESKEDAVADGQAALFACFDALKAVDRSAPEPKAQRAG